MFDPFRGSARGYSDALLREAGVAVATVHDYRDVLFGGHAPEPDDHLVEALRRKMRESKAHIGSVTDGDADRFGIVDEDGTFFQPHYIIALLLEYLVESRGWRNRVDKSVATTNLINALARYHKVELQRDAGRVHLYRRADQAGQDLDWRGRERWALHSATTFREKWRAGGAHVL